MTTAPEDALPGYDGGPVDALLTAFRYARRHHPSTPYLGSTSLALIAESLLAQGTQFPNGTVRPADVPTWAGEVQKLLEEADQLAEMFAADSGTDRDHDRREAIDKELAGYAGTMLAAVDAAGYAVPATADVDEPDGLCGMVITLQGLGDFPCVRPDDGTAGSHDGDCVTQPELDGEWPPRSAATS